MKAHFKYDHDTNLTHSATGRQVDSFYALLLMCHNNIGNPP